MTTQVDNHMEAEAVGPAPERFEYISILELVPSPTNPRKHFDEAKIEELATSIVEHGILQPLVVRPIEADAPMFEIVAGERRYRAASRLAGDTGPMPLPCIIRELDDATVLEIQVIENNQREDVHPLEEAEGFQRLIASGKYGTGQAAVEQLAGKIGKSIRYVYNRLKLQELTAEARDLVERDLVTVSHAELLSRLTPDGQAQAIKAHYRAYYGDDQAKWHGSVRDLASYISREVLRLVDSFPFKASDPDLLPIAGPCTTCPKNTKNALLLFPDDPNSAKGMCTDPACYDAKFKANLANRAAEIKDVTQEEPVLISTNYNAPAKGILERGQYNEVGANTPGAKPALIVDGDKAGQAVYVKTTANGHSGYGLKGSKSASELEEARKQRIKNKYRRDLLASTIEFLTNWECTIGEPVELVLRHLTLEQLNYGSIATYRSLAAHYELVFDPKGYDATNAIRELVARTRGIELVKLVAHINFTKLIEQWSPEEQVKRLEHIADTAGVDVDLIRKEAEAAHPKKKEPEPKPLQPPTAKKPKTIGSADAPVREADPEPEPERGADIVPPIEDTPPVKRGRGRPRKAPPTS